MGTKPISEAKGRALSKLAQELGKRQPFDLVEEELYVSLMRTTDLLSASFRELFAEHKLSGSLYNALRIVGGEQKHDPKGVTVGMIAKRLVCRQPDTTRLVDRLEALKYVTRTTSTEDARCRMISITEKGRQVLDALHRPVRELHRQQFRGLSKKEMEQLGGLLQALRDGMVQ